MSIDYNVIICYNLLFYCSITGTDCNRIFLAAPVFTSLFRWTELTPTLRIRPTWTISRPCAHANNNWSWSIHGEGRVGQATGVGYLHCETEPLGNVTQFHEIPRKSSGHLLGQLLGAAMSRDRKWAGSCHVRHVTKARRGVSHSRGTTESNCSKFSGNRLGHMATWEIAMCRDR